MQAQDFIAKRRDRVIATLLGLKERELDQYLPVALQQKYRKVILDNLNDFTEAIFDVLESVDDGTTVVNELWLQKLDEIHARVVGDGIEE